MSAALVRSPSGPESENSGRFQVFEEDPEPSEINDEDLKEYAKRIGINWNEEQHLLHIAVEGLRSRLPAGWKPCFDTERNQWFYFYPETGVSQWEHPLDAHFRKTVERARRGIVHRDNSVSSSSQRDTCDEVRDIVDDASSIVVDDEDSSGEEDASPILRVDISDKDLTRNQRRPSLVSSPALNSNSIQTPAADSKGFKSVTERLLAKLSARRDSADPPADKADEDEAKDQSSARRESLGTRSANSSPRKGILKKHSAGEISAALSVSEQASNASKSVRFILERQTSLEVKLCPAEITEEDCSKEELEGVEEDEDGGESSSGEEESKEDLPVEPKLPTATMIKPISALSKSPLNAIGRPGSPLGPGLGSPSKKPPARLNPLTPLGKIEKKPQSSNIQPASATQASLKPKPLPPKNLVQPAQQKATAVGKKPNAGFDGNNQPQQSAKISPGRKIGKVDEDEEEKIRRLSAIERGLKEAEREKELQKAGESWERKKETLVRRKSFEMEALEKEFEVKKAIEIQRLLDEVKEEVEERKEQMRRENEETLTKMKEETKKQQEKARKDLEELKSKATAENAERLALLKNAFAEELESLKKQLASEQNAQLDQLRKDQEEKLKIKRDENSQELKEEEEKFEAKKKGLEADLKRLKDQLMATEAELSETMKRKMEGIMRAERQEFQQKVQELSQKLEEFGSKERGWREKEEEFMRREAGFLRREAELKKNVEEVENGVVSRMEKVTHLERMLLEKEHLLQSLFQEKQAAAAELNRARIAAEASVREKQELEKRSSEVEAKYNRLKTALRVVRDRRRQGGARSRSSDGILDSDGDLVVFADGENKQSSSVSQLERQLREQERRTAAPEGRRREETPLMEKREAREEEKPGRAFVAADKLVHLIKAELRKIPGDPRTEGLKNLVKLFERGRTDVTAEAVRTTYREGHQNRREAWASPDNGLASSLSSGCDASPSSSILSSASASSTTSSPGSSSASNISSCPSSPVMNRRKARGGGAGWDLGVRRRFLSGSSGVCSFDSRGRVGGGLEEPYVWYDGVRLSPETGQLVARADKLSREFALRSPQANNPFGAAVPAAIDADYLSGVRRMPFYQQPSPIFATASAASVRAPAGTSTSSSDLGRRIAEHQAWLDRFTAKRTMTNSKD